MSKKNFGLAAQLVRPREAQEPIVNTPKRSNVERLPKSPEVDSPYEEPIDMVETHTIPSKPIPDVSAREEEEAINHFESSKLPKRSPKQVGRPRRLGGIRRINLVLSSELHDHVMNAWRTYRKTSGEFVNGPSGFIEDLIRQHMLSIDHHS